MSGKVDGIGLFASAVGAVLIYGGIKGYSVTQAIGNLVTGKPVTSGLSVTSPLTTQSTSASTDDTYSAPTGGNQSIGQELASSKYGWEGSEWTALQSLWNRESGWSNTAKNPSSGAYGIAQALPYTKMPKAAWPSSAGGTSDATTQIEWGLAYISGRYGKPSVAWAHELANSWY